MLIAKDLGLFLLEVVGQWVLLITGSVLTAVVFLLEQRWPGRVPKKTVFSVFAWGYFVVASFLAWRTERLLPPGADVQHYDSVIRPDRDWRLVVNDRANPATRFTVEIIRGDLRVILENRRGRDRTALPRTVQVEAAMDAAPR